MKEERHCQNCKTLFVIEPADFDFYKKIAVPPPTFCPECRLRRRFSWRNERNLYRGKDAMSGKEIFTGIPPHSSIPVYELEYWKSDNWDPLEYGKEYDFGRPFFDQFKDFMHKVPWPSRSVLASVNADYCDQAGHIKNCYLCFNLDYTEDSAYSIKSPNCKNVFDVLETHHSELSYDSVLVTDCFRCFYSLDCDSSSDVWFSKNLVGCNNCVGCVNLRGKSYYIFNEPYSKEEYKKKFEELNLGSCGSAEAMKKKAKDFWATFPVKSMRGLKNFNSTGECLYNTKNAKNCYMVQEGENLKYVQMTYLGATDSYDYTVWGEKSSRMYEALVCGSECDSIRFSFDCWPGNRDIEYCISCRSSSDCFACIGLKKKQYCIFNKQYEKQEYFELRKKVIGQMEAMPYVTPGGVHYQYGEFFPSELSPFAYNETMLSDYYPLSKEEAIARGYSWQDPETREYQITLCAEDIPDGIHEVDESIIKEIVQCGLCKKAFRIVKMELDFYKRIGIPLPVHCPGCRYLERLSLLNPIQLHERKCECGGMSATRGGYTNAVAHFHAGDECPATFSTAYPPTSPYIVYCEQCYQAEVA